MSENKKLFSEFPAVTTEQWEEKIQVDLKGADYEKKLVWKTLEGFKVKPYYRAENLKDLKYLASNPDEFPYARGFKKKDNNWEIRQDIFVDEISVANQKAQFVLDKGINSLGFSTNNKVNSQEEFSALLKDIVYECIYLNFVCGEESPKILEYLVKETESKKIANDTIIGTLDFDPLGELVTTGKPYTSVDADMDTLATMLNTAKNSLPNYKIMAINGQYYKNAGASIVQELAFSLSQGSEYLNLISDKGISIDDISNKMQFDFAVGSNYFMEIAKLKAARILWANIVKSFGAADEKSSRMYIHSITADFNKTVYDPYVNMLRATTESMSAILGGTNSLYVKPFDNTYKKVSKFSGRIARNIQILLKEEAYFDKIVDPAAGSYYVENLTNSIIEETWKLFLEIESKGGFIAALKDGFIQSQLAETANTRRINIATRREILLGTNQFANGQEKIKDSIDENLISASWKQKADAEIQPIVKFRGAQEFEELRLTTEKASKTPKVFLLTIGNLTMRKARAGFASNFFNCAGFEVIDNLGFESIDLGLKAAADANADMVVLCSSDDEYVELAPEAFEKCKGKFTFVLAGYPVKIMDELKAKGIKYFIHVRSNVLEELKNFQNIILKK